MKRTFGAFMLLAGLSGCVTFGNNAQGDRHAPEPKAVSGLTTPTAGPAAPGAGAVPPAYAAWSPPTAQPDAGPNAVAKAPVPTTLQPGTLQPVALPDLAPVGARPGQPPEMPPNMPVATTPRAAETKPEARQAGYPAGEQKLPEIINGAVKTETPSPAPVAKKDDESHPAAKTASSVPLLRLVNTKRITLNFEIADVGTSGVSSVDLWYTQDGREWKKHEAPSQAKAYVVEVDEEGMYGFTLVARSGTGLGQEPPSTGDQPQVWVIVDLSKPDVQLTEVTPSSKGKLQEVAIKWAASDKNLGRGPVTLAWAETEDGPWQVIAGNLDATGQYTWKVPASIPPKILVRAEAADLAGNVGRAQAGKPIVMDASMPRVSIINVEANTSR